MDVCEGDLLRDGCMLKLAGDVVEDCRYKEKSMAGGSSMRVGIGPVERRCIDFESVYRGDVGSEGGAISSNLQICEQ
jgi:hypothetical protein